MKSTQAYQCVSCGKRFDHMFHGVGEDFREAQVAECPHCEELQRVRLELPEAKPAPRLGRPKKVAA